MVFKYRTCYVVPRDFLTKPQASRVARAQTNVVGLRLAFSMSLPRPQYDAFWRACHHGKNAGSQSMIPSVLRFERTQLPIALELSKVCKEGEKSKRGLPGAFGQSPTPRMGSQQDVDLRLVVTTSPLNLMERTCSLTLMICAALGTQAMNSESNTDSAVKGIRGKRPFGESTLVLPFRKY